MHITKHIVHKLCELNEIELCELNEVELCELTVGMGDRIVVRFVAIRSSSQLVIKRFKE